MPSRTLFAYSETKLGIAVLATFAACAAAACGSDSAEPKKGGPADVSDGGGLSDAPLDGAPSAPTCNVAAATEPLTVATTRGIVRGGEAGDSIAYLGIPYAAPPLGSLRFRAPEPPACFDGIREAKSYGAGCPQLGVDLDVVTGSEDCLTLNVWRPKSSTPASKRPVLFFIHGGANIAGASNQKLVSNLYDGETLAEKNDAVVVTINYRLGALGYLANASLAKESAEGVSGNYGLLDQIAALTWVHENITAFGGDPSRVLVFGESAGAYNTCALVATPRAKGLFSAALMESGTCNAATGADALTEGNAFATTVGCGGVGDVAACLRSVSPEVLVKKGGVLDVSPSGPVDFAHVLILPFGVNADGKILPDTPIAALRKGTHNHVPLVLGTNEHELEFFTPAGKPSSCFEFESSVKTAFGSKAADVLALYPCNPLYPRDVSVAVTTDLVFTCPTRRAARAAAAHQSEPVYRYWFRHASSNLPLLRAYHTAELPFVFGTFSALGWLPLPSEQTLSSALQGYWSRFAANGNPNGNAAVPWPSYVGATDAALTLDTTIESVSGIKTKQCDFWDGLAVE